MTNYKVQAKPYEFELNTETTALIIIDMQRDFLYPGGLGEKLGNDVSTTNAIIPNVQRVLEEARE
ncbi:MAG TPA: isochorismatase family protein, partial [Candidatus Jeotgalibaca pullicola]|nr:isochorismatase family protein [Candidatus Jeotgalibaca pullicola]